MKYNPDLHHRRSIRLEGYDYSQAGAYFITICTHDRSSIFGEIIDGEMINNQLGNLVRSRWQKLSKCYQNVELDESIIMPNHLHGIIVLHDTLPESAAPISEIIRGREGPIFTLPEIITSPHTLESGICPYNKLNQQINKSVIKRKSIASQ